MLKAISWSTSGGRALNLAMAGVGEKKLIAFGANPTTFGETT
jgi:hypothetical protein